MILFKPEHVAPILSGRKTQTRRLGRKRWNVGAVHQCKTGLFGVDPFARVRILDVRRERLRDMTKADVYAEGYDSYCEYCEVLERINRTKVEGDTEVWVVEFERVRVEEEET